MGQAAVRDDILPKRLIRWAQRLDGDTGCLVMCAALLAPGNLAAVPRKVLEEARDRLDRAQERNQFSSEADQQDLAEVIAALDERRTKSPTN